MAKDDDILNESSDKIDGIVPDTGNEPNIEIIENSNIDETNDETNENQDNELNQEENVEQPIQKKKDNKKKFIIIGGITGIATLLLASYFIFSSDSKKEEIQEVEANKTIEPPKPSYIFDEKDINIQRLNKKLALLTKYEIIEDKETEKLKKKELEEKDNIAKELEELEKSEKPLDVKEADDVSQTFNTDILNINKQKETDTNDTNASDDSNVTQDIAKADLNVTVDAKNPNDKNETSILNIDINLSDEQNVTNYIKTVQKIDMQDFNETSSDKNFLKFIQLVSSKQAKNIDKLAKVDKRLSVCLAPENKHALLVGPFKPNEIRTQTIEKLKKIMIDSYAIDLTKEEYKLRCGKILRK